MVDEVFVLTIVMTGVTSVLILAGMIIRAVNRNLDRRAALEGRDDERVELLEDRVAILHEHVQHLEERLEFTERVVARESGGNRLNDGSS